MQILIPDAIGLQLPLGKVCPEQAVMPSRAPNSGKQHTGTIKHTVMKRTITVISAILLLAAVTYLSLPQYARKALIHLYPDIDDLSLFSHTTVSAPDTCWDWKISGRYGSVMPDSADEAYLRQMQTVAYLVIQDDSIIYEGYWDGWTPAHTSNIYSATKSIVSLLVGIALDEGKIASLDDPVCKYIPAYNKGLQSKVTIRNLLTMSGGMDWDESYASLFSATTHGYYGDDLYRFVTSLKVTVPPGVQYTYRSGETQLLAFVLEAATGETISSYAGRKLWKPLMPCSDAYWLLDKEGGDEKAFCCFHTTARDAARFARLMLHKGEWNGRRIISREYMAEAMSPASYLKDQWGKAPLDYYGFLVWIMDYNGARLPLFKGMLGQYIIAIPDKNAIVVRLGHKRSEKYIRETTEDNYRYVDIAMKMLR